jgi:hypothetical protein
VTLVQLRAPTTGQPLTDGEPWLIAVYRTSAPPCPGLLS